MLNNLAAIGWDVGFAAAYVRFDRPGQQPGRVARVDRGVCTVITDRGVARASLSGRLLAAAAADPLGLPCVGDWAVVRLWSDDRLTLEAVLPRRTVVIRNSAARDSHGQVLAANMETAAVVEPLDPGPDSGRVERMLALAHRSGASPLLILTKADLVARPEAVGAQLSEVAPSVPVCVVSAANGTGIDTLRSRVRHGRTMALLGPSGSGKSSLVNALAGTTVMATRSPRADLKGRHTTTHRALVPLPGGGVVLDTPGLRSVGLFDTGPGLAGAFADIEALAQACRFADCGHSGEPGCAVQAAVTSGDLPERRLMNWRGLRREHALERRRHRHRASGPRR